MYFRVDRRRQRGVRCWRIFADLFERAAADGTPIREIVGGDPVEFVETFAQNYTQGGYVPNRERERLISAIDRAEGEDGGTRP